MEENNNQVNQVAVDNELPINPPPKKVFGTKTLVLGILIGVVITGAIAASAYFYISSKNKPSKLVSENITPTENSTTTPVVTDQQTQFGNITWLSEPEKITLPSTLKNISFGNEFISFTNDIYQVANFSDGSKLLDAYISVDGPFRSFIHLIESKGQFFYLKEDMDEYLSGIFSKQSVVKPVELGIKLFSSPDSLTVNNLKLNKTYQAYAFISTYADPQKIADTEFGKVYQVDKSVEGHIGFSTKQFLLRLKDSLVVVYQLSQQPSAADGFFSGIIWNDGTKNTDNFNQNIVSTCAAGGVGVPFTSQTSFNYLQKKVIGKTSNGQPLYQITSTTDPLIQKLYKDYKDTRQYDDSHALLSLDDFVNQRNHFLWQDQQGDWQIFLNNDYSALAECGKPVIYLYPTKETQVKVQVGAQITKSEPTYPKAGWLVTAKPNGELTYQNQSYPYLFWEGLGNGIYPDYKDQGTLVSQKDLVSTVYKQLSQLGLNQKESADFMEFWQPRLPKTPYIRLTWLNTQDMDRLAPLVVNPKPDTNIRIFLEFEGLEKPIILKPQKLSAPKRTGFTLIEWGGLLINPAK